MGKPGRPKLLTALAINSVLLIQDVFIGGAVRGHRLGPWTLAEIIHRIADVTNDLVVMCPHLCELVAPTIWDNMEELSEHAYRYWQDQLKLEPIAGGFTELSGRLAILYVVKGLFVIQSALTSAWSAPLRSSERIR